MKNYLRRRLRAARIAAGLAPHDVAKRMKHTPQWLATIEKGEGRLRLPELARLTRLVGLDPVTLFKRAIAAATKPR